MQFQDFNHFNNSYLGMICDFSDAMRLGFLQAVCDLFHVKRDACQMDSIYAFCRVHFQRSAHRMRQNYEMVPSLHGDNFDYIVRKLLEPNLSRIIFQEYVDRLKKDFPKCTGWLDWYLHSDRANMIFQALTDNKFPQANPNTNAQESFGRTLQCSCEQAKPSVKEAYFHCYRMAHKYDHMYALAREGTTVNYGTPRIRKKVYINDGIPPEHRRGVKKNSKYGSVYGKKNPPGKTTSVASKLAKYEEEAIPWSFRSVTQDSDGDVISVTNTCAHDTVLMALYWLRETDNSFQSLIQADQGLLNTVLDNIKGKNFDEARLSWINYCESYERPGSRVGSSAIVVRRWDETGLRAEQWNCSCGIGDSVRPIDMFRFKETIIHEECSALGENCPFNDRYMNKIVPSTGYNNWCVFR
jgi:hypothetical protein